MGEIMKVSYKIGEIEFEAVGDAAFINEQSERFVELLLGERGKQCKPAYGQNTEHDCAQQDSSSASGENETEMSENETEMSENETEMSENGTGDSESGTPAAGVEEVESTGSSR